MKFLKILLFITALLFSGTVFSAENLDVTTELGTKIKISKEDWPIAFRCNHWGGPKGGQFWFSIRKKKTKPYGVENAWLIFSDLSGYAGELYRNGLDWRFDWTDRNTGNNFSMIIKAGGEGYYYDWNLANSEGRMSVYQSAICK